MVPRGWSMVVVEDRGRKLADSDLQRWWSEVDWWWSPKVVARGWLVAVTKNGEQSWLTTIIRDCVVGVSLTNYGEINHYTQNSFS